MVLFIDFNNFWEIKNHCNLSKIPYIIEINVRKEGIAKKENSGG